MFKLICKFINLVKFWKQIKECWKMKTLCYLSINICSCFCLNFEWRFIVDFQRRRQEVFHTVVGKIDLAILTYAYIANVRDHVHTHTYIHIHTCTSILMYTCLKASTQIYVLTYRFENVTCICRSVWVRFMSVSVCVPPSSFLTWSS